MKIIVYSFREDEKHFFQKFSSEYHVEVTLCRDDPTEDNASLANGHDCVSMITTWIDDTVVEIFAKSGVKFISTRTIGYDHLPLKSIEASGIHAGNISYSTDSVADYTIMLMLMSLRKIKFITKRIDAQNFSLPGVRGRELGDMKVGIIGTGHIGISVIEKLSGFECEILAYDPYPKEGLQVRYLELDEVLSQSDIISLHLPASKETRHMFCKNTFQKMKNGVVIINTARGDLINTEDFIDAVESGKIGAAGLDVIEAESDFIYRNLEGSILNHREYALVSSFPNVIMLPHMAFYTDNAVSDMVRNSIRSCVDFMNGKTGSWLII